MKLLTKEFTNPMTFWVEEYNDQDKEFFESLGFKEKKSNVPPGFGIGNTLEFKGSNLFGLWTKEEDDQITKAIMAHYNTKVVEVEKMNPNR